MDEVLLNGSPVPQECSAEALETMLQSPVMQEFCLAVNALMNISYHHAHLTNKEEAKNFIEQVTSEQRFSIRFSQNGA